MVAILALIVWGHGLVEMTAVEPGTHGVEFTGFGKVEVNALVAAREAGFGDVFVFLAEDADFEAAAFGFEVVDVDEFGLAHLVEVLEVAELVGEDAEGMPPAMPSFAALDG